MPQVKLFFFRRIWCFRLRMVALLRAGPSAGCGRGAERGYGDVIVLQEVLFGTSLRSPLLPLTGKVR